jgi:hypothetical protein
MFPITLFSDTSASVFYSVRVTMLHAHSKQSKQQLCLRYLCGFTQEKEDQKFWNENEKYVKAQYPNRLHIFHLLLVAHEHLYCVVLSSHQNFVAYGPYF